MSLSYLDKKCGFCVSSVWYFNVHYICVGQESLCESSGHDRHHSAKSTGWILVPCCPSVSKVCSFMQANYGY